jgi:twinkle protein
MSPATNIAELLLGNGIRVRSYRAGAVAKIVCPTCEGGRTKEKSLRVVIDADGEGALWKCYRGGCGMSGGGRLDKQERPRRTVKPVTSHPKKDLDARPRWFTDFWDARKIGEATLRRFGVYPVRHFIGGLDEVDCIVFPYLWQGQLRNRKYRPFPQKNPMGQEKDALPTLYNADAIEASPEEIVFVEGEPDVLAMAECEIFNVVSIKDGAPEKAEPASQRYQALATHESALARVTKIILAGDMDKPGKVLRDELARRLGMHRCWTVDWPEGCKDAGETLVRFGPEKVKEAVAAAEPLPLEGILLIDEEMLVAYGREEPPRTMSTGTIATDQVVKLPTEGRLIILTGYPQSGKTAWARYVMVHTAMNHDRRWCVFSPESQPLKEFAATVAQVYMGKPFKSTGGYTPSMTEAERRAAGRWLKGRIVLIGCEAVEQPPTIDWLLTRATGCVLRHGITDFMIDPWNEIVQERGDMSETDYIGYSLQQLKAFGLRHEVNIWMVAHPRVPLPKKNGEPHGPPGPYDISASAHWYNKADVGLTVHATEPGKAELWLWKARLGRFGRRGSRKTIVYNEFTGRYADTTETLAGGDDILAGKWGVGN